MLKEELFEYGIKFVRKTHKFKELKVLLEREDIIIYNLKEELIGSNLTRNVLLIALRSSIQSNNGWFMFSPSLTHREIFANDFINLFDEIFKSNTENGFT